MMRGVLRNDLETHLTTMTMECDTKDEEFSSLPELKITEMLARKFSAIQTGFFIILTRRLNLKTLAELQAGIGNVMG